MNMSNPIKRPLRGTLIIMIITRQVLGRPVCERGVIPEDEKLYANYALHFNFGPIERGGKQNNNID